MTNPADEGSSHPRAVLALAVAATFFGSFLLFALEPFIGKILLPAFGGTPLLWNTCMVFFQIALLIGYLYASLLTRLPLKRQVLIQVVLLTGLFIIYPDGRGVAAAFDTSPGLALTLWLVRHVLLPFTVLAALTTLIQAWFARATRGGSVSPYRLYAASNVGSMVGLFAYPLLLEPQLSLSGQRAAFLSVVALVVVAVAALGLTIRNQDDGEFVSPAAAIADSASWRFDWRRVVVFTAIPASLLLGVTNYLLTDIASLPLFWVIPLALYLVSFIVAFAKTRTGGLKDMSRVFALACILMTLLLAMGATAPASLLIPLHLMFFAVACVLCHIRVASMAPPPELLPQYYLAVSAGGAVGGILTLLVPPLLTHRMLEYPVALILSSLVIVAADSATRRRMQRVGDAVIPIILVGVVTLAVRAAAPAADSRWTVLTYIPAAMFVLGANTLGGAFTVRLASLFFASVFVPTPNVRVLYAERTFFGRVQVLNDAAANEHVLLHGSTVHGVQRVNDMSRCAPTTYYHPSGPAGHLLLSLAAGPTPRRVALVGLGAGALTCYARAGEAWDLFELDPVVARIAGDARFFTFLRNSKAEKRIVLGDARLALGRERDGRYQLIIVDAFSSDAIPIHLLTREAIAEYSRTLSGDGVMLFHVSNRFFHLRPVLAAVAPLVGFTAFVDDDVVGDTAKVGKYPSEWVVLARDREAATLDARWHRIPDSGVRVWTDGYSNPLSALGFAKALRAAGATR